MKMLSTILLLCLITVSACRGTGKDAIEKADSTNQARLDTALNRHLITIDEGSSVFLVRASDETAKAEQLARNYSTITSNREVANFFSETSNNEHALLVAIRAIAGIKQVALPDSGATTSNPVEMKGPGKSDTYLVKAIVASLRYRIELFENALLEAKDPEIRSFADKNLPNLRQQLETATQLYP